METELNWIQIRIQIQNKLRIWIRNLTCKEFRIRPDSSPRHRFLDLTMLHGFGLWKEILDDFRKGIFLFVAFFGFTVENLKNGTSERWMFVSWNRSYTVGYKKIENLCLFQKCKTVSAKHLKKPFSFCLVSFFRLIILTCLRAFCH